MLPKAEPDSCLQIEPWNIKGVPTVIRKVCSDISQAGAQCAGVLGWLTLKPGETQIPRLAIITRNFEIDQFDSRPNVSDLGNGTVGKIEKLSLYVDGSSCIELKHPNQVSITNLPFQLPRDAKLHHSRSFRQSIHACASSRMTPGSKIHFIWLHQYLKAQSFGA